MSGSTDKIRPVGFNLGGWLSQSTLEEGHVRSFIQEKDFKDIAGWGFNSVRLPVDAHWLFEKDGNGGLSAGRLEFLKKVLGWAQRAGLLTILDLHQTPCHSFAKPELENLWKSQKDLDSFCRSWAEVTRALEDVDAPIWFDVLNEPTAKESADWNRVALQVYGAIREEDPGRVVMIESTFWGSVYKLEDLAAAVKGPNLVYSFHFYLPMFVTHQQAHWWKPGLPYLERVTYPGALPKVKEYLAGKLPEETRWFLESENRVWNREALRELLHPVERLSKGGHRVYCGEFGVYERAPREARLNWTKDVVGLLSELKVGWAYWNYKWLDFGVVPEASKGVSGPLDEEMLRILQKGI
jgi:endoglucanase